MRQRARTRGYVGIYGQLVFLSVIHFWIGVGLGVLFDMLQVKMDRIPKNKEDRREKRNVFALQVTLVMVLLSRGSQRDAAAPGTRPLRLYSYSGCCSTSTASSSVWPPRIQ